MKARPDPAAAAAPISGLRTLGAAMLVLGVLARAAVPLVVGAAEPVVIGVAAGPGAAERLDRALDSVAALRAERPRGTITIALGPGIYRLTHPLRIGPEHAGRDDAPLIIRGAPGSASRLSGSVALAPRPGPLDPALAARLPAEARDHVLAYRLPAAALTRARIMAPHLLKAPSEPLSLAVFDTTGALEPARWPKSGWAEVPAATGEPAGSARSDPSLTLDSDRIRRWRGEPDLWAEGYWRWGWLFESIPVAALDAGTGRITLADLPYEGIRAGARFRIVHALSELDGPGQWWRDEADGLLLAWPRTADPTLEVAVTDTLIEVEGASHVRIEGLALAESRGDLVAVRGGSDVTISGSHLAWAGRSGAVFEDTRSSGVEDSEVADTGGVAVVLDGGRRDALVPGGLFLRRSSITRWARMRRTQSPAVAVEGVGAEVSGNLIHDAGDAAVHLHGNDHRVLHNEIAHVLAGATDAGAIYAGRDWTARGTVIAGNFIHDVQADPGAEVKGVYLDDESSGFTVRDNLFLRVEQAVFIGGGRDNTVENNVFVACVPAIHVDSRGQTWAANAIRDPHSELRAAFAAMPVASALWRRRYPGLAGILSDRPEVAKDNRLVDNLFVLSRPFAIDDGGRAAEQIIHGNRGPADVRLRSGEDIAAVAARAGDPGDFAGLVDAAGTTLFHLDPRAMRR